MLLAVTKVRHRLVPLRALLHRRRPSRPSRASPSSRPGFSFDVFPPLFFILLRSEGLHAVVGHVVAVARVGHVGEQQLQGREGEEQRGPKVS